MGSNYLRLSLVIFFITSFISCVIKDESNLYGTYVADYDIAKEKLMLNKNGTFIQEVMLKVTSKVDTTKGAWVYDPNTRYVKFTNNYMQVLNGFKQLNPEYSKNLTSASFPVNSFWGNIMIEFAEGVFYEKAQ